MYVLGIDTSTKVAGAAIAKDGQLVSERFIHNKLTHSQVLVSMVDQVIKDAGISPRELEGLAVTGGPGSFTGLRIGMAFVKTMAQVLTIPIAAVSTLEVMAANVISFNGLICPIMDARKNEVYTSVYKAEKRILREIIEPRALGIEGLADVLRAITGEVLFLGDGVPVFYEQIRELLGARAFCADPLNLYPRAGAVALLGTNRIRRGEICDLFSLAPVYLRRSEAEITWEKKRGEADEKNCCHDLCTP